MAPMSLPTYPSNVIAALMRNAAHPSRRLEGQELPSQGITRMADAFVDNHRDKLLAGALRAIERSPELQRLLEKEQLEWAMRIAQSQAVSAA